MPFVRAFWGKGVEKHFFLKKGFPAILSKTNSLNTPHFPRALVNIEDDTLRLNRAIGNRETSGHHGAESMNNGIGIGAENAILGAAHTEVGNVSRPEGQNLLVGGGDVGMCAKHHLNTTVKIATNGKLFAGRLCVNIKKRHIVAPRFAIENSVNGIKGRCKRIEINSAADIDAKNSPTVHTANSVANAGGVGGVIGRANDAMLVGIKIGINILHTKSVVAKGDKVNACSENRLGIGGRNAANFGGVLSVSNAKVNFVLRAKSPKLFGKIVNGYMSNNVAKGKIL